MRAKLLKPIRYGTMVFDIGEVGEVVNVHKPLTYNGEPIYDFYVKFNNQQPIGLFKTEVELIE